jgi:diaminopimelate decarboxylase
MLPTLQYVQSGSATSLHIASESAEALAARFGTPLYVYSQPAFEAAFARLKSAFSSVSPLLCYALKASGNIHILRKLADMGAGMDVVSGGELERAWLSGVPMDHIVFAGVGKTRVEIAAALSGKHSLLGTEARGRNGESVTTRGPVGLFNIESEGEARRIAEVASELNIVARGCIRVNPNVDAHTHKYTTTGKSENKFGIDLARVAELFDELRGVPGIQLVGIHMHLGSPIASAAPYAEAISAITPLLDRLQSSGHPISVLNIGGGYGINYGLSAPQNAEEFGAALCPLLTPLVARGIRIVLEPGRSIIAQAGVLLTRVQYVKQGQAKRFVICDAGMHTLIRPALYQAYHFIWPVSPRGGHTPTDMKPVPPAAGLEACDVVGPICESSDFLATDRVMPRVEPDDLLAVFCAGAYGMSMSFNYNDHPRPAEVLVGPDGPRLIRSRQTQMQLVINELEQSSQ